VETESDLTVAVDKTLEAAREMAVKTGLFEEEAVARTMEGMLQAAEGFGLEVVATVRDSLPPQQ